MTAGLYEIGAKLKLKIVTNFVTNLLGNPGHSRANCHQFCYQTEGTSGHSRAMESSLLGRGGKRRASQGNALLGLITQRSKVQILPPQPIKSITYSDSRQSRAASATFSPPLHPVASSSPASRRLKHPLGAVHREDRRRVSGRFNLDVAAMRRLLCSWLFSEQIILHRFNAPTWLKHIQRASTALGSLTPDKLNSLAAGAAFVWSSKATDTTFTTGPLKIKCRPRATLHGGTTQTAVD